MKRRIVDLSYPIHEGMTTYPADWHPKVRLRTLGRHGVENRETRELTIGTHTGTHCDAPSHFLRDGASVDSLSLDVLIGPALLIDLTYVEDGAAVSKSDIAEAVGNRDCRRLVLRFDWSDRWGSDSFYKGHPFLGGEAIKWMVDAGVELLALDTPTPDSPAHGRGSSTDSPNHKVLLANGIVLVEYLCNLRELTTDVVELIVLPLKLLGADGSPARVVAIEQGMTEL